MHTVRSPTATNWSRPSRCWCLVRVDLPDHDDYRFIGQYEGERICLPSVAEAPLSDVPESLS